MRDNLPETRNSLDRCSERQDNGICWRETWGRTQLGSPPSLGDPRGALRSSGRGMGAVSAGRDAPAQPALLGQSLSAAGPTAFPGPFGGWKVEHGTFSPTSFRPDLRGNQDQPQGKPPRRRGSFPPSFFCLPRPLCPPPAPPGIFLHAQQPR